MNDQKPPKSNLFKKILVSITLLVDGVLFAGLGYIFLIFMAMLDPVDFDVNTKYENIYRGQTIYLVGLFILVVFLLAAIFWSLTKRVGKYLAAGLCIFFVLAFSIAVLVLSPILGTFDVIAIPLFLLVLAVLGLNIYAIRFVLSKGSPAISDQTQNNPPGE